ncbi:Hypothetical protein NTJ_03082 [Nesidiocoris tenuis]|uniref:Uncharacterized protein n=1 Tax=Nesidiocoris tenuis TaxID=355587 RepID=A0ABN7ADB6_9HEMI|nr:Hypothetical protein NTJ_03082 [Nesidiocoris tenuis]
MTKQACGFKDGKFEIKCPIAKNADICPGDNIFNVPGGAKVFDMLLGKVGAKVDLITDKGNFCYEGEGVISKA